MLGANLTLRSSACRHAIRLAVAAALASALARALRLPHDYWVPLTVLWLLRPDFGSTFTRGVQRYAGTTAGAVLATLFAATVHPGPYALSILATALSVGIFCFMLANYGVTGACTTGWVVFVSALAGIPELRAAADRVLDTSLGAVIALGGYLLWPTWERGEVGDMVADVIDAARRYATAVLGCWLDPDHSRPRRRSNASRTDARVIRTNTEATLARSIAEPASSPAGLDPDIAAELLAAMRRFCDGPLALEQSLDTADARRRQSRPPRPSSPNWTARCARSPTRLEPPELPNRQSTIERLHAAARLSATRARPRRPVARADARDGRCCGRRRLRRCGRWPGASHPRQPTEPARERLSRHDHDDPCQRVTGPP